MHEIIDINTWNVMRECNIEVLENDIGPFNSDRDEREHYKEPLEEKSSCKYDNDDEHNKYSMFYN